MGLRTLALSGLSLCLAACSSMMPAHPDFSSGLILPIGSDGKGHAARTEAQYKSRVTQVEPSTCTAFDQIKPGASLTATDRNACIADLMTDIDDAYGAYEAAVSNRIANANVGLDIVSGASSTISAATSGTAAKVFAAISAISTSSKAAISSDLLLKSSIQVVIATMRADRAKQAAAIKLAEQGSLGTYSMAQAKGDLLVYLYAGTVPHALNDATQDAAATAQKCGAAAKKVAAAVDSGATVVPLAKQATAGSTATTTSDQCNQLADNYSFTYDTGISSAALRQIIAPGGIANPIAMAAANACVKSEATPDVDLTKYLLPKGNYDLATLSSDPAVASSFKDRVLACVKAAVPAS